MALYGGDHRGQTVNIVNWTFLGLTWIVVGMRLFSRLTVGTFGRDDALILFALAVVMAHVAAMTAGVDAGYGEHIWNIPPEDRTTAGFRVILMSCIAVHTFSIPKLAIVALLERLLELRKVVRIIFWGLSIIGVVSCLVLSISWFVQCTPRAHQWDPNVPGTCWDPAVVLGLSYYCGIYSGILDMIFALYPPFVIWKLHLSTAKKIFISASLGGGLVAAVTTFYKITTVSTLSEESKTDPTFSNVPLFIWTSIEAHLLIITASLPTIGPCVRFVRKRYREYTTTSGLEGSTLPNKTYQSESRRPNPQRGIFSSRSHHHNLPSEHDMPRVDIERAGCVGSGVHGADGIRVGADASAVLKAPPDSMGSPYQNRIWKETEVEVRHGGGPASPPGWR